MSGGYAAKNGHSEAPVHRTSRNEISSGEDFPQVCEVCLGQNPYVKMVKLPMGAKLCKISNLAYQAFRWKAGPQGRYKETIISYAVAKEKNICQTCLNDMQYGLPVGVRDKILRKSAAAGHQIVAAPESDIGSRYHYQNLGNDIDNVEYSAVGNMSDAVAGVGAARELDEFARARASLEARNKTAFRNLPKLCSFWLGGGCGRVARKTCPFRPCCGVFVFPELAGSKANQELMQPLVRDLEANGPAAVMKTLEAATRTALQDAQKGNRDNNIKKRVMGTDDLSNKYLGHIKSQSKAIDPPDDESITTLWVGNVEGIICEQDLFDAFYCYGRVLGINILRTSKCAFVEYSLRAEAEAAAASLYNTLVIKGHTLSLNWSKPRPATGLGASRSSSAAEAGSVCAMPAPPGMESAHLSAYALPGMCAPVSVPPPLPPGPPPSSSSEESSHKRQRTAGGTCGVGPAPAMNYSSMDPQRLGAMSK